MTDIFYNSKGNVMAYSYDYERNVEAFFGCNAEENCDCQEGECPYSDECGCNECSNGNNNAGNNSGCNMGNNSNNSGCNMGNNSNNNSGSNKSCTCVTTPCLSPEAITSSYILKLIENPSYRLDMSEQEISYLIDQNNNDYPKRIIKMYNYWVDIMNNNNTSITDALKAFIKQIDSRILDALFGEPDIGASKILKGPLGEIVTDRMNGIGSNVIVNNRVSSPPLIPGSSSP